MSLPEYNRKRKFKSTPEPQGKKKQQKNDSLAFVVQKHHASHQHFDFRLEVGGVLKSWAVPKGPSIDPAVKRLAMMVEDHPFNYKDFEGIIPEGNYGAGTVIVWDRGTWEPLDTKGEAPAAKTRSIRAQLHKGQLKCRLNGEKLKGDFLLIKAKGEQDNAWLLMKLKDKHAGKKVITKQNRSVLSGQTIEEVAATSKNEWKSNRRKKSVSEIKPPAPPAATTKGKRAARPETLPPMLATLAHQPFDDPGWVFEIKWDGYRAIAAMDGKGNAELSSRKGISLNKYTPILDELKALKLNAVLDGEIVVLDKQGLSNFQMLQSWAREGKGELCYMVFDLPWYNGRDLTNLPLRERKKILQSILPPDSLIRYCDHVEEKGREFYDLSTQLGVEGVIAKDAASSYTPGLRSKAWLKWKNVRQMEAVIAGFTEGRNSRKYFGALVLGSFRNDLLEYIGHTGSGMDERTIAAIYQKLKPLTTDKPPFARKPKTNMPVTWVKPELVCEVKYQEVTADGILRIPIFLGLREDKSAAELKKEAAWMAEQINGEIPAGKKKKSAGKKKIET